MYILTIDTTGVVGSCALTEVADDGKIVSNRYLTASADQRHLAELVPMIHELLTENGDMIIPDAIAASKGPGSFTGIRIGVSTARALAQAWNKKIVPVKTLDSFCANHACREAELAGENQYDRISAKGDEICCGIIYARRGQVYGIIEGYLEGGPYMLKDVLDVISAKGLKRIRFYGDGADHYEKEIHDYMDGIGYAEGRDYFVAEKEYRYQRADFAAVLAVENIKKGELYDYGEVLPDYMRRTEAEVKLEKGQLPVCRKGK